MKTNEIKIAIISSSFRREVSDALEKNCLETLQKNGVDSKSIDTFSVPGSWEIPLVAKKLASKGSALRSQVPDGTRRSRKYDAIITFGAIVKGDTYHFEQIANEVARALMQIQLEYEIPVIFEVLAVYHIEDALIRATRKKENKGVEAAKTALAMIDIMETLNSKI